MNVKELNQDQLNKLKVAYVCGLAENEGRCPDIGEVYNAQDDIANEIIYELFADITFTEDDFCTTGGC